MVFYVAAYGFKNVINKFLIFIDMMIDIEIESLLVKGMV